MRDKCIALLLSTILLNSAFFGHYTFFGVYFFLIPIFWYTRKYNKLFSFKDGFIWGVFFFTVHCSSFLQILINKGCGQGRVLAYVLLVIYMSLHSGIWFFFANQLTKKVSVSLAWLAATVGYFFLWIIIFFGSLVLPMVIHLVIR